MGITSEARKRAEEAARLRVEEHQFDPKQCKVERRREVAWYALAAVYPHASMVEADALLDQFDSLGASLDVEGLA